MTISSTTVKNSYSGNGTLDTFNYTFKVFADADLQVIIRDASATETVKTLTTHYTVTGAGSASGGTVVFTAGNIPTATETVVIRRASPQTQAIDYIANDPFPAESHEEGLDRSMMAIQQLQEEIDRSIKLSRTNTMNNTEFTIGDTDRANKVFGFDSAGELVVTQELGTFRGDWSASTAYAVRDLVKDTSTNNIFICLTAHTSSGSQPLTTNADSAKWSLLVDAAAATTSATNAANSASAAATSETNAATSESNAATSEANAAASYDDFDDRYLGAKASNPTVDNDGNALIDGALYFDTTNNVMKVYDLGNTTWRRTTPTTAEQTNINTVSGISSNVTTVANNDTNVTTVATNISSVNTVATNINDVIKVADDLNEAISEVETVANDLNEATSEIEVVANNITNVNTVGTNISNVNTVAGISSDVTTVANDGTDIGTVATNIANVNTVAGNNANITTVAGNDANITTVAGISSNVTTVANDTADIGTVASDISNVNTVAGSIANVNTVATNVSDVNNFADRYRVQAGEPSVDNDEGDLVYDTTANAVKVYNGTSFDTIQQGITDVAPTRHSIRPSLNLDFANSKVLDPRITFTRGSNATYYDGYTSVKAEENLVKYSQEFDNAYWTKASSTITANATTAPDGTTTAELLTSTSSAASNCGTYVNLGGNGIPSGSSLSCYFKAGTSSIAFIVGYSTGNVYAVYNLSTQTLISSNNCTPSIVSVGNSWYRITLSNSTASSNYFIVGGKDSYTSGNPWSNGYWTSGNTVYIWGAQLEQRDTVTAYTPTTTQPITKYQPALQTAGNNVARFDHNPTTGESLGLLIEESRTNLLTYSEEFDNAYWSKSSGGIEANAVIAPTGMLTGDKLVAVSNSLLASGYYGGQVYRSSVATISGIHTWSCYAKAGECDSLNLLANVPGFAREVVFNLSNGTFIYKTGSSSNTSVTMLPVGNGWYRCSVTPTNMGGFSGDATFNIQLFNTVSIPSIGYSGIYIWGAQFEAGSFPTSYIKTTGSQVTRSAENASMTGTNFTDWYNNNEGTMYAEYINTQNSLTAFVWSIRSSTSNRIFGIQRINQAGSLSITRDGSSDVSIISSSGSLNVPLKMASGFVRNDVAHYLSGSLVNTDTSANMPFVNQFNIGSDDSNFYRNGTIKKLAYYPTRLTNNELQDLTEE